MLGEMIEKIFAKPLRSGSAAVARNSAIATLSLARALIPLKECALIHNIDDMIDDLKTANRAALDQSKAEARIRLAKARKLENEALLEKQKNTQKLLQEEARTRKKIAEAEGVEAETKKKQLEAYEEHLRIERGKRLKCAEEAIAARLLELQRGGGQFRVSIEQLERLTGTPLPLVQEELPEPPAALEYWKIDFKSTEDGRIRHGYLTDEQLSKPTAYYLGISTQEDQLSVSSLVQDPDTFRLIPASYEQRASNGILLQEERNPPVELPARNHYFRLVLNESSRIWNEVLSNRELLAQWRNESEMPGLEVALYMTVPMTGEE